MNNRQEMIRDGRVFTVASTLTVPKKTKLLEVYLRDQAAQYNKKLLILQRGHCAKVNSQIRWKDLSTRYGHGSPSLITSRLFLGSLSDEHILHVKRVTYDIVTVEGSGFLYLREGVVLSEDVYAERQYVVGAIRWPCIVPGCLVPRSGDFFGNCKKHAVDVAKYPRHLMKSAANYRAVLQVISQEPIFDSAFVRDQISAHDRFLERVYDEALKLTLSDAESLELARMENEFFSQKSLPGDRVLDI